VGKVVKKFCNEMPEFFIGRKNDFLATVVTIFAMQDGAASFTMVSHGIRTDLLCSYD
jgi:hypothetical protein